MQKMMQNIMRGALACWLTLALTCNARTWAQTLPRSVSGLLYQTDFSIAAGWIAGPGWGFDPSLPAYCVFDPTPLTYEYGALATATDGDGVREFHLFEDSAGVWWLFYGAGDRSGSVGTAGAGAPWRIHLAKSTDRGVTWQRLGPINVQLQTGTGGNDAAKDMLYMEQRGSTFYLHVMRSATANATGVPAGPYTSQMWTNTTLGTTGWTYANEVVTTGSLGNGNDTRDDYTGCVVGSNSAGTGPGTSVYHLFTSTSTYSGGSFTGFGVGHFVVSGPSCANPTPHPTNPTPLFVSTGGAGLSSRLSLTSVSLV